MNIKRIIREEIEGVFDPNEEDWEWASGGGGMDITETTISFDPPLDYKTEIDKVRKVFKILSENDVVWSGDGVMDYRRAINDYKGGVYTKLKALFVDKRYKLSFFSLPSDYTLEDVNEDGFKIVDGRDLFEL